MTEGYDTPNLKEQIAALVSKRHNKETIEPPEWVFALELEDEIKKIRAKQVELLAVKPVIDNYGMNDILGAVRG